MGMDDVEALVRVAAAQLSRGLRVRTRAGGEGKELEVDPRDSLERLDLVAHETARGGALGRRPQVRDDEDPHRRVSVLRGAAGNTGGMGVVSAAVLPLAAVVGVLVAVTRPLGADSVVLVVAVLALAGIALAGAGWIGARSRRR
jgi:hypothetical protein